LPDGIFANQKSQLWCILEGLGMEHDDPFCGHLVYFIAIWYILWAFGIFNPHIGMLHQEKSGNPASAPSQHHDRENKYFLLKNVKWPNDSAPFSAIMFTHESLPNYNAENRISSIIFWSGQQ
jgi:hypothetical protein